MCNVANTRLLKNFCGRYLVEIWLILSWSISITTPLAALIQFFLLITNAGEGWCRRVSGRHAGVSRGRGAGARRQLFQVRKSMCINVQFVRNHKLQYRVVFSKLSNLQVHEEEAGHPSAHSGLRNLVGFDDDIVCCADDLPARFGAWRADQRRDCAWGWGQA